jgi:hypothetical protein
MTSLISMISLPGAVYAMAAIKVKHYKVRRIRFLSFTLFSPIMVKFGRSVEHPVRTVIT